MWWSVCAADGIEERQTETQRIHFTSSIIGRVSASVESNFDFFFGMEWIYEFIGKNVYEKSVRFTRLWIEFSFHRNLNAWDSHIQYNSASYSDNFKGPLAKTPSSTIFSQHTSYFQEEPSEDSVRFGWPHWTYPFCLPIAMTRVYQPEYSCHSEPNFVRFRDSLMLTLSLLPANNWIIACQFLGRT